MTTAFEKDLNHEPSIYELLDDPIAQLLMQRDGVERHALDPMLQEVADKVDVAEAA